MPKDSGLSIGIWAAAIQARPVAGGAGEADATRDRLYADGPDPIEPFHFDERVARVFPDMIVRSVPGYETVLGTVGLIATRFVQPGSACYDLGCSLGAVSRVLRPALAGKAGRIVAVDNSPAMLEAARQTVPLAGDPPIEFVLADVRDAAIADASVVVLNYTLQFVPLADRLDLLRRIRSGLRPGGVLILSEKIRFPDPEFDRAMTAAHEAFKQANGYSALEISRKRAALERVLVPETLDAHRERLAAAGFRASEVWFQCLNFASLLATT
jgi:tRNA (cmo5U34)-methyltransferase